MNINELTKMKQSKYFYKKTEMFLKTCDEIFNNLQSVLGSEVVEYDNESFYMEGVFFDIKNDRKWRNELFIAIRKKLTNFDYGLMKKILKTVIKEEALFLFGGKKFANHRVVVKPDEIYVEMKHPLLQSFSRAGDTKSFLEYLKENDEEMYYNFFLDEEPSTFISELLLDVSEIKPKKLNEWKQYINEALTELKSYDNIYEDMKSELFGLVVDTAIESYLGTLRENMY